jgi:hypothetical protein
LRSLVLLELAENSLDFLADGAMQQTVQHAGDREYPVR